MKFKANKKNQDIITVMSGYFKDRRINIDCLYLNQIQ